MFVIKTFSYDKPRQSKVRSLISTWLWTTAQVDVIYDEIELKDILYKEQYAMRIMY